MKKITLLILITPFYVLTSQNKTVEIDTVALKEKYSIINKSANNVILDTTYYRILNFKKQLTLVLKSIDKDKKKTNDLVNNLYDKTILGLIFSHTKKGNYDSIKYYHKIAQQKFTDNNLKGIANFYRANGENINLNSIGYLEYTEKAIENFKLANNKKFRIKLLLSLAEFHYNRLNFYLLDDIITILTVEDKTENFTGYTKGKFQILKALTKSKTDGVKEGLILLKKFDIKLYENNKIKINNYYYELSRLFFENKQYANTIEIIDKFLAPEHDKTDYVSVIQENLLLSESYINLNKLKKASFYLKKINAEFSEKKLSSFAKYNYTSYLFYKKTNNVKKALNYLEIYNKKNDSLNNKQAKQKASILNYNLKKEKELVRLEGNAKLKDIELTNNKKFYTTLSLFLMLTTALIIFLITTYFRKRKSLKLKVENKKNKEILELKNTHIENLSHEIRTPIAVILGYVELIKLNVFNTTKVLSYADKTIKSGGSIIDSLDDFLSTLKLDKKPLTSKLNKKSVHTFFEQLVASFEGASTVKGIKLYYKSNIKKQLKLEYDYVSLTRILNNLIVNAIKYSNGNSAIKVKITLIDKELVIIVKDEGIGISEEDLPHIFSRFFQSKEHSIVGGFGIGLFLVDTFVKNLNGKITVVSKLEHGSIFKVILPIKINDSKLYIDDAPLNYKLIETIEESEVIISSDKVLPKILIIDDNTLIIKFLKDLLSIKFDCSFAFNGTDGLEIVKNNVFDLVISDLQMPLMDGFSFKKELNTIENYANIPFILMSATKINISDEEMSSLGIDHFILKPFENNEILFRINELLENNILTKNLQNIDDHNIELSSHYAELIKNVQKIVHENLVNQDFNIKELAKQCGYSQKQLSRILIDKTGLTPVKIILEIRLLKAHELIINKKYKTINEVVYAVGLNSISYFNNAFFKRFELKAKDLLQ